MIGTYKIINSETGIYYYGSSCDVEKRLKRHKRELDDSSHHCIHLQRAYTKYGSDTFSFEIHKKFDELQTAREYEQYILNTVKDLYNVSRFASGGDLISNHPNRDDIVIKMTNNLRERYAKMSDDEKKDKYGKSGQLNGMYGKHHTTYAKKKMSNAHKGNKYALGLKRSDDTKAKLSKIAKTRTGEKNPFHGKTHTEETRKLISQKNKGNIPQNVKKISIDGIEYISLAEASRKLNIPVPTIHYRLKKKYENYICI